MLVKVEFRNRRGASLVIPFEDLENGFGVASIEGLDPVEATLVSAGFAGVDGEQYYSAKRAKRNIKMKIDIIPDFENTTPKTLRNKLYEFLMPKKEVTVRFHDSLGSYVDIVGRVESLDAPLFTSDPVADVSILCFDPDFFDPISFKEEGVTVAGSAPIETSMTTIGYLGSVEAGFIFRLKPQKPISSFSIEQQTPGGDTYKLDFADSLVANDELIISTISGSKGVSLTRGGSVSSLLRALSPQSKWLELEGPGDNWIRVVSSVTGVPWSIEFVNRYGGL